MSTAAAPSEYGLALPAVTVPFALNAGLSFGERFGRGRAWELVAREGARLDLLLRALPAHLLDRNRNDLIVECAARHRGGGLLLAAERPRVLILRLMCQRSATRSAVNPMPMYDSSTSGSSLAWYPDIGTWLIISTPPQARRRTFRS
jgi:hypothetical protein